MADSTHGVTEPHDRLRLEHLDHQLRSWQALLETADGVAGASTQDRMERRVRVDALRARVKALRARLESDPQCEAATAGELPPLESCGHAEQRLCASYLHQRSKVLSKLSGRLASVLLWVDYAVSSQQDDVRVWWRLYRIRRFVLQLQQEQQRQDPRRALQNLRWHQLSTALVTSEESAAEALEPRPTFEKVARLCERVESLQNRYTLLNRKLHRMDLWLQDSVQRLKEIRAQEPPLADDLKLLIRQIDHLGFEDLQRTRSRLALARRYIEDFLDKPSIRREER